jgi:hypothetical protein
MYITRLFNISIYLFFGMLSALFGMQVSDYLFETVRMDYIVTCQEGDSKEK